MVINGKLPNIIFIIPINLNKKLYIIIITKLSHGGEKIENDVSSPSLYQMDDIGNRAKFIDSELTIFERMRIPRSTIYRIGLAITFYFVTMGILIQILH
jgi:hypothetical protein